MATKKKKLSADQTNAALRAEVAGKCSRDVVNDLSEHLTALGARINPTPNGILAEGNVVLWTGIKFVQKTRTSAANMQATGNGHIIDGHASLMRALFDEHPEPVIPSDSVEDDDKEGAAEGSVDPDQPAKRPETMTELKLIDYLETVDDQEDIKRMIDWEMEHANRDVAVLALKQRWDDIEEART